MGAFIEEGFLKLQAEIFVFVFFDFIIDDSTVRMLDPDDEFFGKLAQAIVKYIAHRLAIDGNQPVTGCKVQFFCDAAWLAASDQLALFPGHVSPLP